MNEYVTRTVRLAAPPLLLSAVMLSLLACGGGVHAGNGNAAESTINPSSAPATKVAGGSVVATAFGNTFTEAAGDNRFSLTNLIIAAGQTYTLTVQNRGQAVHNWHITDIKGANGKDVATQLVDPGKAASITFSISKPGVYHFQCDVHPQDMVGTLTVR